MSRHHVELPSITKERLVRSEFMKFANENRKNNFFCDVVFVVEDECIRANRFIAAFYSPFFDAMLKANAKEKNRFTIEIKGLRGKAVRAIIDYFYDNTIAINNDTVMDLLKASDFLQVESVKQICLDYLMFKLSPDNSIAVLSAAILFRYDYLLYLANDCIITNMEEVILTPDFKNLSQEDLSVFLSVMMKHCRAHEAQCRALLIAWIQHDYKARQKDYNKLIQELNQVGSECSENDFALKLTRRNRFDRQKFSPVSESDILKFASKRRNEGLYCDVNVEMENGDTVPAHRLVLAFYSPQFDFMFKTQMAEEQIRAAELEGESGKALQAVIEYFYNGNIEIRKDTVVELLEAAEQLGIEDIKQSCLDFLRLILSRTNWIAVYSLAAVYQNGFLAKEVYKCIHANVEFIVATEDFKNLSKKKFCSLLSRMTRNHKAKSSIYKLLIIKWIEHDFETRRKIFATELFQKRLDLGDLSSALEEDAFFHNFLVSDNVSSHDLENAAFIEWMKKEYPSEVMVSFGGLVTHEKVQIVYCSNFHAGNFLNYPHLPEGGLYKHCSLKYNDLVYCIGGRKYGLSDHDEVWEMNLQDPELKWTKIAPMLQKRCYMGAACFENTVVVVGGDDGCGQCLKTVEFYDPNSNIWQKINDMTQKRCGNALVSFKGYLYAIGGRNSRSSLSSVERLKDLSKSWKTIKSMNLPRESLSAVCCHDYIFAIGGRMTVVHNYGKMRVQTLASVEKYDHAENSWTFVRGMNISRADHSASVLNGKIYVVGGRTLRGKHVKEIECYDPLNDRWTIVGETEDALWYHTTATI